MVDVVHGDLKPENVLIFKDSAGKYSAKVIDFGCAAVYGEEGALQRVAMSKLWNAPEHSRHERKWKAPAGKRLDYFSFGMLCLWILFETHLDYIHGERSHFFIELKQGEKLSTFAEQQLESEHTLDSMTKSALRAFFASTLDSDQNKRDISSGNIFGKQRRGYVPSYELQEIQLRLSDADFRVSTPCLLVYT